MNKISAKIVADSINPEGNRITTMEVVFPRIILSEFNTHRMFSRNSASSRAIPFKKMLKMVEEDPFIPIAWQKAHKGMQGSQYFDEEESKAQSIRWLQARDEAIRLAKSLNYEGVTKQITNRLLEPFMYHKVLVTATEWDNFFKLRAHEDAEIHIADLAYKMQAALQSSTPKKLKAGEWHIPFGDNISSDVSLYSKDANVQGQLLGKDLTDLHIKIATARCARISYQTLGDDPKIDYEKDIALHDQLLASGHMSPFEHCARAMSPTEYLAHQVIKTHLTFALGQYGAGTIRENGWCRNFKGFIQYREIVEK